MVGIDRETRCLVWVLPVLLAMLSGCDGEGARSASMPVKPEVRIENENPEDSGRVPGFSGKVIEAVETGRYVCVLVDTGTGKKWAASPAFPVKAGDEVKVPPDGMWMQGFHSKTLNRTFETIYFCSGIEVPGRAAAAASSSHFSCAHGRNTSGTSGEAAMACSGLEKPEGGKTVGEVHAGRKDLEGKGVLVRGKVVKFHPGIMGKNWLHLQDGTGKPGSDDLTVTTTSSARVGDTVLVEGKVSLNRDFGFGYRYDVLIEEASVTVEGK